MTDRITRWLYAPQDVAALVAFRIVFGTLVCVSALRFLAYGWVEELFLRQSFRFSYWGFSWLPALPAAWVKPAFVALAVLGLLVAVGLLYRVAIVALFALFTWIQLYDVTNYLNHYYLVSLLALLMIFMPLGWAGSVDAQLWPARRLTAFPRWCTALLRFQVGTVYFFAGLAKLNSDWLLHAQPLNIWLSARTGLPVVGPLLDQRAVAFLAAWGGFLFDTSAPLFLSLRRTRLPFYVVVIGFHAATRALFPIGMFPFIMVAAALVFFDSSWPRRWLKTVSAPAAVVQPPPWAKATAWALATFCAFQLLMPLRAHLYGGNVSWHEQGMRFSWRVMSREKNGSATFDVVDRTTGRHWEVSARRYLTQLQEREMATQPDLIWQLAQHIGREFNRQGHPSVEVHADVWVSLNGRVSQRLLDPKVDLLSVDDALGPKRWVLPEPAEEPIHLKPLAAR